MNLIDRLLPRPQVVHPAEGILALPTRLTCSIDALPPISRLWLSEALAAFGTQLCTGQATLGLTLIDAPELGPEAYRLRLDTDGIQLAAAGSAGLFYGIATLCQWLRLHQRHRPGQNQVGALDLEDHPHFPARGVMLDVSRNKVPTMATLLGLVDHFAALKLNQLQLYLEHSFAYAGHQAVWSEASPLTPDEIRELDNYCAARFIELVPNQNSFGHFHRWLIHEPYRALAECPEGVEHAFSSQPEPFSLCATDPGALALLEDLYGQLLPLFRSRQFNVGLDETFDLGLGRSAEHCARMGKTRVYLDFLGQVHAAAARHGRRIMFWGDIIVEKPELIPELPEDVIALEWGYEAGHPFAEHGAAFSRSGRSFYVCPGTSSWNTFAGRVDNALENLRQAAHNGRAHGAAGYLITDWGDRGHLQPLPVSFPGFLAGAALAWHVDDPLDLQRLSHALVDQLDLEPELVDVLLELGLVYRTCGATPTNGSALFFLYWFIDKDLNFERLAGLSATGLEQTLAQLAALTPRLTARPEAPANALLRAELSWTVDMLAWCARLGLARFAAGPDQPAAALAPDLRQTLRQELDTLCQRRHPLWLARNRPGGWQLTRQTMARIRDFL